VTHTDYAEGCLSREVVFDVIVRHSDVTLLGTRRTPARWQARMYAAIISQIQCSSVGH